MTRAETAGGDGLTGESPGGPAGIYLHVPFCSAICPYCDFAVRRGDESKTGAFADVLIAEIGGLASARLLPEAPPLADAVQGLCRSTFDSIYFGGGTPSLLPAASLEKLLEAIRQSFELAEDTKLFLEANPEDVSADRVRAWRESGVTTLSLGVQALDEEALRFLGRGHRPRDAVRAIELARTTDFETMSIDLIYGLPGQTREDWRRQLELALELGIDHLSLYELEIHERTVFGKKERRGELQPLAEDARAALFLETHERLGAAGFEAYEVSNFARAPEHRSRHNLKYWRHVPYLGLGPSAHSFVTGSSGRWRFWNERLEPRWRRLVAGEVSPAAGWERLAPSALALEAAMLGLRTRSGLDLEHVERLSGLDLAPANAERLAGWRDAGWIELDGRHLRPTSEGMARADRLAAELEIPSSNPATAACSAGESDGRDD